MFQKPFVMPLAEYVWKWSNWGVSGGMSMVTVFSLFTVKPLRCKAVRSLSRAVEITLETADDVGLEQHMSSADDGIDICRSSITEGMCETYRLYCTGPSTPS